MAATNSDVLARIRPTQLGLWSFAVEIAHGAGLMLVPIYLGLCRAAYLDKGHEAAGALINTNLGMAVLVSVVHSVAMIAAGGFSAWLVYRYLGLKFVSRSWFNLDAAPAQPVRIRRRSSGIRCQGRGRAHRPVSPRLQPQKNDGITRFDASDRRRRTVGTAN
jgi:hypothetical protein